MERRISFAVWVWLAGALAASCGGNSVSHVEDTDGAEDDGGPSGGDAGDSGENGGRSATGGSATGGRATGGSTTGGRSTGGNATGGRANGGSANGGSGASSGGLSGAAGTGPSGSGGTGGSAGEAGAAPCTDQVPPDDMACGDDLTGTWSATACTLRVSGVVNLNGLGLSTECLSAPVAGSLQVSGTVTFDGATFSDDTITTGESTFELAPACLSISGTETTCDVLANPLQALGYASVRCVSNEATLGCTCVGDVEQHGGLGFVSFDASTYGTYATMGNEVTLTAFGIDTEYASCVSPSADTLTLSLVTVAKTGTVSAPIVFVKQ